MGTFLLKTDTSAMNPYRALRYLAAFSLPLTVAVSFTHTGWWCLLPAVFTFVIIPLIERVAGSYAGNLSVAGRDLARRDRLYDLILYLTVPVQIGMLIWFIRLVQEEPGDTVTLAGRTVAIGLMCGVFGINVAHELGHRTSRFERTLARIMLCTSLYMHFYIEHNRGHHRNVGTPEDPATARKGESVYRFWVRSIIRSFSSAWSIVAGERIRKKRRVWSAGNEMIQYLAIEAALTGSIFLFGGWQVAGPFLIAALIGILLLETVNYIEHYGLSRVRVNEYRYEDVEPRHSWNSDYILGRLVLFELTRHSDHHWEPSKHYQLLDSMPGASQLPAGYPAMMLLSLCPPLWFRVMNSRIPDPG
jgi:alkane 1-monooxygenase